MSLGKNLGLSLIAEGVELEEHMRFLQDIGCDEMQGYYFSRPISEKELIQLLSEQV